MDKILFYTLRGKKVSVLVDNITKFGIRESYVGVVREVMDDYVYLDIETISKDYKIKGIYLPYKMILSVWEY